MAVSTKPCDLHEITNCSICTGLDKATDVAERNEARMAEATRTFGLPPGHTRAEHPGHCAGCGRSFDEGTVIRHSKTSNGWVNAEGSCGC